MRTLARTALLCASSAVLAVGLAATGGPASAANPHTEPGSTGQPGKECGEPGSTMTPGMGASGGSFGSPFNEGHAADVYAGAQEQNNNNPHSVSQYDVACFQVTSNR